MAMAKGRRPELFAKDRASATTSDKVRKVRDKVPLNSQTIDCLRVFLQQNVRVESGKDISPAGSEGQLQADNAEQGTNP